MKKLFIILFTYISFYNFYAQNSLKVSYLFKTNLGATYNTTAILEIDNYQTYYIVLKSSDFAEETTINTEDNKMTMVVPESENRPVVYVDILKNKLYSKVQIGNYNLLVEDLPKIEWKIKKEFKKVNNLNCQKAIGYFRGRTYTVWFSSDIPLPYGPWKLQGLPGLIIEAIDDNNQVYFSAFKIEFNKKINIDNFPVESEAIPLKKFISEILPKKFREIEAQLNSKTDRNTTISINFSDRSGQKEIIYEWEETEKIKQ